MRDYSNLNLCFLAGTLEHGGAERQLYYILQALSKAGANARVLSLDRGEFWEERIKNLGVSVTCVGNEPSRLKRFVRVLRHVRKEPLDVLQSQHFYANAYIGLAGRICRIHNIGALRNDGKSEMNGSGRGGGWLNLHSPGTIAANSQVAIRYAISQGVPDPRLYFLPNVVDTEQFKPANSLRQGPVTLLAVGRLVKQKRFDRFISILSRLRNLYRLDVRGLIVGPGCQNEDLRPKLKHQARQLGLFPDFLEFRGGVSETRSVYHEAEICVLTSDHEGTPNVLLEAMASGLPVVAANVGGVPDIVQNGTTGFLLPPNDLEGFTATLAGLIRNTERRMHMSRQARAFIEAHHSLHRLPSYLDGLYRQVLSSRCFQTTHAQGAFFGPLND